MKLPEKLRVVAQMLNQMCQREFDHERLDCLAWARDYLEGQAVKVERERKKKAKEGSKA